MARTVEGGDQRGKLLLRNVLKLVDREHDRCLSLSGCFADRDDEVDKVRVKVPAIGKADFWLEVDSDLQGSVFSS